LHHVFHGIRFKVNKKRLVVVMTTFFLFLIDKIELLKTPSKTIAFTGSL